MVVCGEAYVMRYLWDKKKMITKMVPKNQYVDPRISYELLPADKKEEENHGYKRNIEKFKEAEKVVKEEYNPTCLVDDFYSCDENQSFGLVPIDSEEYSRIKIKEFPFFVGKGIDNVDYSLEKEVISRYHAKILKEEEKFFLVDLNSTNGSFINGEKLLAYKRCPLHVGDEIALANIRFRFAHI